MKRADGRDPASFLIRAQMWHELLRMDYCSKSYAEAMHWYWLLRWVGAPV